MKKKMMLWIPVILLFIAGLACSAGSSGTGTDTGPTADPNILFTDDFSSNSSGWDTIQDTTGMTDYDQGGYRIQVLETNTDYWANPNGLSSMTDVSISVDVKKLAGPDDNDFAILCRYVDENNFYAFLGSSDGFYGITKVVGGSQDLIGQDSLMPTEAITKGEGVVNTLRADCVGSTLTLYINGTQIASVQDTTFTTGNVGLMAGTYDDAGTDILFDNFVVRKP